MPRFMVPRFIDIVEALPKTPTGKVRKHLLRDAGITASSLDDPSLFKPQFEIFTSDAQPWDHMDSNLPKFEKYAPS